MCSPARSAEGYKACSESMIVDPMGRVLEKADGGEDGIVYVELKPKEIENTRAGVSVPMKKS